MTTLTGGKQPEIGIGALQFASQPQWLEVKNQRGRAARLERFNRAPSVQKRFARLMEIGL
jgi:hypothetical protein